MGQETVFNYMHLNNDRMIAFLRSKGYTVLNLIEIRKLYKDEKISTTIKVENIVKTAITYAEENPKRAYQSSKKASKMDSFIYFIFFSRRNGDVF